MLAGLQEQRECPKRIFPFAYANRVLRLGIFHLLNRILLCVSRIIPIASDFTRIAKITLLSIA